MTWINRNSAAGLDGILRDGTSCLLRMRSAITSSWGASFASVSKD